MADIEERLRSHADAFSGLMSLIPAKLYYGEDVSDQWQRKKQTKEQARNAKREKLDPDRSMSAKDVLDENARKRKRDEENEDEVSHASDSDLGTENPKEGLKRGDMKAKKQKQSDSTGTGNDKSGKREEDAERQKLKAEKRAQKKAAQLERKKAKQEAKKERRQKDDGKEPASEEPPVGLLEEQTQEDSEAEDNEDVDAVEGFSLETKDTSAASPISDAPSFEMSNDNSGSSSISSIVPPSDAATIVSKQASKITKSTSEELRQRLQKRLAELRAARHADGLDGKPARTRQELIEARRRKAEERKQHKKELRQQAKEEEQRKKDEEMQRRFSPGGTGSLLASPRSPAESLSGSNSFSFGRISFPDGQHADPTLTRLLDDKTKHGPRDPAAALKVAETKKARLAELDEEKRADIEEKDMWLNAKKRAHGERVRDDTSLLKKALKRKESAKKKSEREWKERVEGVNKGKEMRQQRRDENIRKRKEDRGAGGGGGKKAGGGKGKPKARPGFEGSFKAKAGGKKK